MFKIHSENLIRWRKLIIRAVIGCAMTTTLFTPSIAEEQTISLNPQALINLMVSVNPLTTHSELIYASESFKQQFTANPQDRYAKLFYGYTQIFLATQFLERKNYLQAAERAKTGFFYIDEAIETRDPSTSSQPSAYDLQLHYLRLRMDAFIPKESGRCPIAINDLTILNNLIDPRLRFMLDIFATRIATECRSTNAFLHSELMQDKDLQNKWNWTRLLKTYQDSPEKQAIIQQSQQFAPAWQPEELSVLFNQGKNPIKNNAQNNIKKDNIKNNIITNNIANNIANNTPDKTQKKKNA